MSLAAPKIIRIPFVPMSRNARDRAHWSARKKELDDWTLLIPQASKANKHTEDDKRRLVEIVFCKMRGPMSDPDNLYARAKVPLDALTRRGWIRDDGPQHIELRVREEVTGKKGQTIIAVSERIQSASSAFNQPEPIAQPIESCPDGEPCENGCRGGCWRATYGELKGAA